MSDTAKSKTYWGKGVAEGDPFALPKRVSRGVSAASRGADADAPSVRYLWIFVTEEGLQRRCEPRQTADWLGADEWLNVVDESSALGAEWMVIYAGAALARCPEVWALCEWAQQQHQLRVGIHLAGATLAPEDVERLTALDASLTFLIADEAVLESLASLQASGIGLCRANVREDERHSDCGNPKDIVCVGIDGHLFTCGLVLGDEHYRLGSVLKRGLSAVMQDKSLPHAVPDAGDYPTHGCDGCPSHVAYRAVHVLPR